MKVNFCVVFIPPTCSNDDSHLLVHPVFSESPMMRDCIIDSTSIISEFFGDQASSLASELGMDSETPRSKVCTYIYNEIGNQDRGRLFVYNGLMSFNSQTVPAEKIIQDPEASVIYKLLIGYEKETKEVSESPEFDSVTHPSHYTQGRNYEPRLVIEDWDLTYYLGNVVKYISRAGRKGDKIEDLEKAMKYLEWEIERLKKEDKNK